MSRRLITDRDVLEGRCGARIELDGATLITPSARDRAMRAGIVIVEAGAPTSVSCARCGGATCAGSCAGGCAGNGATGPAPVDAASSGVASGLGALPDGLYLVRIEGGRAVSTLPATGPGLMPRANLPCPNAARGS